MQREQSTCGSAIDVDLEEDHSADCQVFFQTFQISEEIRLLEDFSTIALELSVAQPCR